MSLENAIRHILEQAGVPFKTNARSFVLTCPHCGKPEKLYLDRESGFFVCWVCAETDGFKGSKPDYALSELTGRSRKEIQSVLYGDGSAAQFTSKEQFDHLWDKKVKTDEAPPEPLPLSADMLPIDSPDAEPGRQYLIGRGVPTVIAKLYGVHYWARFRRVIFPVVENGICYGYQARMIDPCKKDDIKILSSRNLPRKSKVMFADRLKGQDHAVISEGPFDALKCHLCGGNIATMGKHITAQQIAYLKSMGIKKFYFALDEDAWQMLPELVRSCNLEAYMVRVPPGREDMGASSPVEVLEQFRKAERITGSSLYLCFDDPKKKK